MHNFLCHSIICLWILKVLKPLVMVCRICDAVSCNNVSLFIRSFVFMMNVNLNDELHLEKREGSRGVDKGWIHVFLNKFKKVQHILYFPLNRYNLYSSLPTTIQQRIKITSKHECNNTLPTIYKCKSHANVSTLPNTNS